MPRTTAFAAPSNGAIGARKIAAIEALAGGIGRWARISDGAGNAVADLDVSTSPEAPLVFSSVVIEPGAVISINALVLRMPATQGIFWSGTVTPNIATGNGITPRLTTATTITLD